MAKTVVKSKKSDDTEELVTDAERPEVTEPTTRPSMDSVEWTNYVLSQLDSKTELVEKKPKASGLRRVFSQLTGWKVVESFPTVLQCPSPENERRATVMFTMVVNTPDGTIRCADASDCYWANTTSPYNKHPIATAATMAEGRVLRKLMKLNVVTLEETLQPTAEEDEVNDVMIDVATPIDHPAKVAIENICNKAGIDVRKMLMFHKMPVPADPGERYQAGSLSKKDGQMVIQICIGYQKGVANGGIAIPEEIKRGNK